MDYSIKLKEDQKIIIATASGEWETQTDNAMVRQIMQTVISSGSRKILVDIRELHFNLSIIQIFERAKELGEQRRQIGVVGTKVAIVYPSPDEKLEKDF